jgi:hypothetical protein
MRKPDIGNIGPPDIANIGPPDIANIRPPDIGNIGPPDIGNIGPPDIANIRPLIQAGEGMNSAVLNRILKRRPCRLMHGRSFLWQLGMM